MSTGAHKTVARLRRLVLAAAAACLLAAAGPLDELPTPAPPPDPQSLLEALKPRLAPSWRLGQPSSYLGIAQVKIVILDQWRGNPVAAAIALCPDTEDAIWDSVRIIRLIMRHRQRDWPPYECRP